MTQVRKGNWRNHFVNGHGFTIGLATFAVCFIAAVVLGAAMAVSGTAKEVQELAPAPKEYRSSTYGAKHSGVGFANYVVGNAVQSFWQKEMGKKGPASAGKLSDPFASFLLKKKGKKGASDSDETPEQQADDAQPVDEGVCGCMYLCVRVYVCVVDVCGRETRWCNLARKGYYEHALTCTHPHVRTHPPPCPIDTHTQTCRRHNPAHSTRADRVGVRGCASLSMHVCMSMRVNVFDFETCQNQMQSTEKLQAHAPRLRQFSMQGM